MAIASYTIPTLDCPAEEAVIRQGLKSVAGIDSLEFDLFNRRLKVTHGLPDDVVIVEALRSLGMEPSLDGQRGGTGHEAAPAVAPLVSRREILLLSLAGALALAAEAVAWSTAAERSWPVFAMSAAAVLLGGLPTIRKGFVALRTFTLNINFLMSIAVVGAFAIGEYAEAALVVTLFAAAELIEKYSLDRARNAVRALMELAPDSAFVKQPDGSWTESPAAEVPVGAEVRVRPGERLPLDGLVTAGSSAVNQAPITGESVPVDKLPGDLVFAGTINESGVLEFKTTGGKDQTTLARIVNTVQEAQSSRAPTQQFVDRFARIYTPIVCVLAVLIAAVPPLLLGQPLMPWIYNALVLLVIACPCALVISTPVTIVSGLAAAAREGILVKGGVYLEHGRLLRVLAVDKTGTITEGKPKVTDFTAVGGRTREEVLKIAASLDALSQHPIARAVVAAWNGELLAVEGFASLTGRGVTGRLAGKVHYVGNHRLAHERGVCSAEVEAKLAALEAQGKTAIVVADAERVLGILAVADTPRPTSIEAVRQLHALGVRTAMLSGDNHTTTAAIARMVGIDDARGDLLPDDKIAAIDEMLLTAGASGVGMVGDGVNDAPALAKASIGFAMGAAGTDAALETADVALMQDDLRGVPAFIRLSQRTSSVLRQNIALALGIKAIFFLLAIAGAATLWMAVLADMGASLLVVGNGLRLLHSRPD